VEKVSFYVCVSLYVTSGSILYIKHEIRYKYTLLKFRNGFHNIIHVHHQEAMNVSTFMTLMLSYRRTQHNK